MSFRRLAVSRKVDAQGSAPPAHGAGAPGAAPATAMGALASARVKFGNPSLDAILEGGLPHGAFVSVRGRDRACVSATLCRQYVQAAALEPGGALAARCGSPAEIRDWLRRVAKALAAHSASDSGDRSSGAEAPPATVTSSSGPVPGSTAFLDVESLLDGGGSAADVAARVHRVAATLRTKHTRSVCELPGPAARRSHTASRVP